MINMEKEKEDNRKEPAKNSLADYFKLGEVWGYYFRKKDPNRPTNINIKIMHGINRIALFVFLAALIVYLVKKFFFS